ncbi:MAG: NACHT domain-containing protein [Chlamydiales bacterium]
MLPKCSSSSSPNPPLVTPLQIDFREKEEEARRILTSSEIQAYALNALQHIRQLSKQITHEIHFYNSGNFSYREAIDGKIQTILRNHIAKGNRPRIPLITQFKSLKAFFYPIKKECKRLKEELFHEEIEMEKARKMLQEEKDRKLSLLLKDEQEKISSSDEIMGHFFNQLKEEIADKDENPNPTVYFAYAWPIDERKRDEYWVQTFLKELQSQLNRVGIPSVQLDIVSNRYGANIYKFMKKAQTSDYVLLFGTESLKDKHDTGLSAVCTELIHIFRKRQLDVKKGLRRVFPILISGSHQTAFPPEYERYITVRDWRQGAGYLHHFQSLFLELFQIPPKEFLGLTNGFLKESMKAFPKEANALRRIQEEYRNIRQQINHSTSAEEAKQFPATLLLEVEPPKQPMDVRQMAIEKLKQCYLSQSQVTIFTASETREWGLSLPINSLYTQLAMITKEDKAKKEVSPSDISTNKEAAHTRSPKEIPSAATSSHIPKFTEASTSVKSAQEWRVVIFGPAGIGKTTWINQMLYSWANGGNWNEFHAIFSIRLKNINKYSYPRVAGRVYTAKDILEGEYSSLGLDFQALLADQTFLQNSLLILEGYDELSDDARIETRHLANAFNELKARFPNILMTSRPGNVQFNHTDEFEILGFNNPQILRYIYYSKLNLRILNTSKRNRI